MYGAARTGHPAAMPYERMRLLVTFIESPPIADRRLQAFATI
jgi:hypothetical protein